MKLRNCKSIVFSTNIILRNRSAQAAAPHAGLQVRTDSGENAQRLASYFGQADCSHCHTPSYAAQKTWLVRWSSENIKEWFWRNFWAEACPVTLRGLGVNLSSDRGDGCAHSCAVCCVVRLRSHTLNAGSDWRVYFVDWPDRPLCYSCCLFSRQFRYLRIRVRKWEDVWSLHLFLF